MKNNIIKTALIFCIVFNTLYVFSQTYTHLYKTVNIWNSNGQNPHDFLLSYDVINGRASCTNNFEIVSKVNFHTTINFSIYLNGILKYTGKATMQPFGKVFFNDAFSFCNSNNCKVEIFVN